MNAHGGPSEARRAKEGASADSAAREMKDTTGVNPWYPSFLDRGFLRWQTVPGLSIDGERGLPPLIYKSEDLTMWIHDRLTLKS